MPMWPIVYIDVPTITEAEKFHMSAKQRLNVDTILPNNTRQY